MSAAPIKITSVWDAIDKIRDPYTRFPAVRTLVIGCLLAGISIAGTTLFTQVLTGLTNNVTQRLVFPARQAEIERLRRDVSAAPCGQVQQLLATVVTTNQQIDAEKRRLETWWLQFDVTPRWENVSTIKVPCGKEQ